MIEQKKLINKAIDRMPEFIDLYCSDCKKSIPIQKRYADQFFISGWPRCCGGFIMELRTVNTHPDHKYKQLVFDDKWKYCVLCGSEKEYVKRLDGEGHYWLYQKQTNRKCKHEWI